MNQVQWVLISQVALNLLLLCWTIWALLILRAIRRYLRKLSVLIAALQVASEPPTAAIPQHSPEWYETDGTSQ